MNANSTVIEEARVDGYTIDFSPFMDESTRFPAITKSQFRGMVGKIGPTNSGTVNVNFRVGNALQMDNSMTRCDYTNTTCYKVRGVPVINSISQVQGYTSGGQLISINGCGFAS